MSHDPFQIALEHHHAGRLARAEAGYRALLAAEPDHADALHWLGVLLAQAGQIEEAVQSLERAVAQRPADVAFVHNLGQAYVAVKRDDEAIAALTHARDAGVDAADLHLGLGVAMLRRRRIDEAITALRAAVSRNDRLPQAHYHLAAALRARRESPDEVRCALERAVELDPAYTAAWQALGVLEREAGNGAAEAEALRRVQESSETETLDRPSRPATVEELERRLTPDESMQKLHAVLADAVGLVASPTVDRESVAALFDRYADTFDTHLREKLGYRVPEVIAQAVARVRPGGQLDVLDLGCGTGLSGAALRPMARTLAGVDLSPGMIEKARARGVYDRLEVAELVDAMNAAPPASLDLLVAADVLNYLGDLAPTMEAAAAALRPGGLFVFTVEAAVGGETRFRLNSATHRYAHAEPYVRHVTGIYGYTIRRMGVVVLRADGGVPVRGYLVTLERPAAG